MPTPEATPIGRSLRRSLTLLAPACLLLPVSFLLPRLDLTGPAALAVYGITESGGRYGLPTLALLLIALVVLRPGLGFARRRDEAVVMLLLVGALLGGSVMANEHLVKSHFGVPRPSIEELVAARALPISAKQFYRMPDKKTRTAYLRRQIDRPGFDAVALHPLIRAHWVKATGFSFPSGHAFGAMMFASFFLGIGISYLEGPRLWPFHALPLWALLVCFSRPLLRVHYPLDVTVGGLEGAVLGSLLFLLARALLDRRV